MKEPHGQTCVPITDCSEGNVCLNGGVCENIHESPGFTCICPPGFVGKYCDLEALGAVLKPSVSMYAALGGCLLVALCRKCLKFHSSFQMLPLGIRHLSYDDLFRLISQVVSLNALVMAMASEIMLESIQILFLTLALPWHWPYETQHQAFLMTSL